MNKVESELRLWEVFGFVFAGCSGGMAQVSMPATTSASDQDVITLKLAGCRMLHDGLGKAQVYWVEAAGLTAPLKTSDIFFPRGS